jgi:hypothetical protein
VRRALRLVAAVLLVLASGEGAARLFWRIWYGLPFARPDRVLYAYYPELAQVDAERPARDDGVYDVLLLGGSVLNRDWGSIEADLRECLTRRLRRRVRVFNLAQRAHTSRDSRLKYEAVPDARFDLVAVYDGINDVRANNVPPGAFADDYSHLPWYGVVNALAPFHGGATLALSFTPAWIAARARSRFATDRSVSPGLPREDWVRYGKDARSAASFEHNLAAILDLATRRGDPVLLMTFAVYLPRLYSARGFEEGRLDYALHTSPAELWGKPEYVVAAVERQNDVVRRLAAERPEVVLVDQARLMAGSAESFNDPCHLTVRGSVAFVDHLVAGLGPRLDGR